MSTWELVNKKNDREYIEEDSQVNNNNCYRLLKVEYERCRQEVHDFKRKLELSETMLREVQEANETIERSLGQEISEKEKIILEEKEKHRVATEEYENIIQNLERTLAKQIKEIEELRQCVNRHEENLRVTMTDDSANVSLETNNPNLRDFIVELEMLLQEERKKSERAEEIIKQLQTRSNEFEHIARNTKEQLEQKNRALEDARAELEARTEARALEMDSARRLQKGNSLFAEVEDRRQNVVDKMNTLREKYIEAKRICKAQMAEIKTLKTERATTFTEWKNYTDHTLAMNDDLAQKYKHRISDLENKLKSELKKKEDEKQLNSIDPSFGYFQCLLNAKKKEINELGVKIEDLSTQLLLQEETKLNITKQLQYWQQKASVLEAQVSALQGKLELDSRDNANYDFSSKDFKYFTPVDDNTTGSEKTKAMSKQQVEKSNQPLPSDASSKSENTTFHLPRNEQKHKIVCETGDEEKSKSIEELKIVSPNEFQKKKNSIRDENKCSTKIVRFVEDLNTERSNNLDKLTEETQKYPVVYIPIDSNNL